ncbi:hypothetical protein [uncultured Enterococcus sp.]
MYVSRQTISGWENGKKSARFGKYDYVERIV